MKRISLVFVLLVACQSGSDPTTTSEVTTSTVSTTLAPPASSTTTAGTTAGGEMTVSVGDFSFGPSAVTIKVGESVTWNLSDGTHTTTSGVAPELDGLWNQALTPDTPFTFTFEEAGTFPYFCRFHADFMSGVVTVEP